MRMVFAFVSNDSVWTTNGDILMQTAKMMTSFNAIP